MSAKRVLTVLIAFGMVIFALENPKPMILKMVVVFLLKALSVVARGQYES